MFFYYETGPPICFSGRLGSGVSNSKVASFKQGLGFAWLRFCLSIEK